MKADDLVPRLLRDVFDPSPGERALVMTDVPGGLIGDHADWADRRKMAAEWRQAFATLAVAVDPLLTFATTGAHNADWPAAGRQEGRNVRLEEALEAVTIVVAMTEYSVTAPLFHAVRQGGGRLRAASMPGVLRSMERTALSADVHEVARRASLLAGLLEKAAGALVVFSTGHEMFFDLRFRRAMADGGLCRRGMADPLVNLPSGEAFIVPYEGEREGEPSRTEGRLPVACEGGTACLAVAGNRIVAVDGDPAAARAMEALLAVDAARRNVAELGLGCNDRAIVSGVILEDEKAGMHWACGRSDHLGGVVGAADFSDPSHVLHRDWVYARGCPVEIRRLVLRNPDGTDVVLMRDGEYTCFPR